MISCSLYLVTGRRRYRNHRPGDKFEARLDPDAERRAVERGDIKVLKRIEITLVEGSYALPRDWPPSEADDKETPQGVPTQGGE